MENLFITVMFLFVSFAAASTSGNCSSPPSDLKCNISIVIDTGVSECSLLKETGDWFASVKCSAVSEIKRITCMKDSHSWNTEPNTLCSAVGSTTPSKSATTQSTSTTTQSTSTTTQSTSTQSKSTQSTSTQSTSSQSTSTLLQSSISTRISATGSSHETATFESTEMSTRSTTTRSQSFTDDSGSVVVPIVSVFIFVVVALAVVIVFIVYRHRRIRHQKAKVDYSGTSISNRGYDDGHGLDRHISLLDMRYDDSNDSGYAEISPGKVNVEEGPDNEYQTINDLPEDKMEGNSGYGHLKMQTTKFIDNNYSHVAVNQNGKQSTDVTYAHTGNPLNGQEFKDDEENENTYNHLETNARKIQGIQQPLKNEEKEVVGDVDAEYNHAKAGHLALEPDNKGDTYSHLNNTQNPRRIQHDDLKFLTHGSKTESYRTKTGDFDSDKGDGKNTFSEYAKCAKKVDERETPKQVGRDGYETPAGAANIYFTLEPESKLADRDVLFQVTNETFEDSEGEESPNHQYFILEKTDTNT